MKASLLAASCAIAFALGFAGQASAQIHNEHYACYDLKNKHPKGQTGTISNQVEALGTFEKCKLKQLCVPTLKNGGGIITNPTAHYCTYQCKGGKPAVAYTVTDQFGAGAVTTKKLRFIMNSCAKS